MTTAQDDFECDLNVETEFIGREHDLQSIREAWKSHRTFGIFGLRSVGKSRLVNVFLTRNEAEDDVIVIVDVRQLSNIKALYSNLCIKLGVKAEAKGHESDRWIHHIVGELRKWTGETVILFFDNIEDYQEFKGDDTRDSFLSFCKHVTKGCKHVKLLLTSTTRVQFPDQLYFSHKVLPLGETEARQLLRSVSSGVNLGEFENAIVTFSEGLPLLILMIGSELTEDNGLLTPNDMVECLLASRLKTLSKEFYPKEDRVADVYKDFIDRLADVYKHQLTVLEYIPGTFNVNQVKQILDADTDAMVKYQTLKPMLGRHFLDYDSGAGRFNIQGILRECLHAYYTIKNLPEIRARYCRIFTAVMVTLSKRMNTRQYTEAMAEFTVEHPNLQKLLTDIKYTTQDTYHFFIQIATDCTGLVDQYMAGDGEEFYQGCTRIADMFGKDRDKAVVHIAVGSFYTNVKSNLVFGLEHYDNALQVLKQQEKSLQLVTVYQRKGWNLHQQGKNIQAVKYFKKALDMSTISGKEYQPIARQALTSLGLALTVLGQFEEAEKYHFESLRRRKELLGEDHPFIGSSLNNIGIMYYQKGDSNNALRYYKEGLEVKKKSGAPVVSVVYSLSNTANMYSETGNSGEAHSLLNDALKLLDTEKVPLIAAAALVYDTKGKVYRREGDLKNAEEMFQKAVDIRQDISQENVPYLESLVHLANIEKRKRNFSACIDISSRALKVKEKAEIAMPQNPFIKECLECLAEVYKKIGEAVNYRHTLWRLESELLRLEKVHIDHENDRDLHKVRTQIRTLKDEIDVAT